MAAVQQREDSGQPAGAAPLHPLTIYTLSTLSTHYLHTIYTIYTGAAPLHLRPPHELTHHPLPRQPLPPGTLPGGDGGQGENFHHPFLYPFKVYMCTIWIRLLDLVLAK